MSVPTLLAMRELRVRWGRAVLAAAVVAGAVALSAGLELLGRGRERAVEAQLDAAGPALRVFRAGVSAADVAATRLGGAALPADAEARVRAVLGRDVRRFESRSVLRDPESGAAVVAVREGSAVRGLGRGRVVVGSGLAERWGGGATGYVRLLGRSFLVGAVAPSNGDASDFALLVRAEDVGGPASNELRIFLEPGIPSGAAAARLQAALPDLAVLTGTRSDVADGGMQGSLAAHRRAIQLVTVVVAIVAMLVATHLDVSERRRELALLACMGLTRASLAALVVQRAISCALAGALVGLAAAVALTVARPELAAGALQGVGAVALAGAALVAAVAAIPVATAAARRDPVGELQDG